ncbi:hypothetical protein Hanom_Chr06g00496741 [Helianthus anomalus]
MFGPGLPGLFLVPVSFGPGKFNGQDPPLFVGPYARQCSLLRHLMKNPIT